MQDAAGRHIGRYQGRLDATKAVGQVAYQLEPRSPHARRRGAHHIGDVCDIRNLNKLFKARFTFARKIAPGTVNVVYREQGTGSVILLSHDDNGN
jgi:hypothetical protein